MNSKHKGKKFILADHPWLALAVEIIVGITVLLMVIVGANSMGVPVDAPYRPLVTTSLAHVLVLFLIVPFTLKLPYGRSDFREYISGIRLANLKPFFPLVILSITCSVLALLALASQALFFRFSQGLPVTLEFLQGMIPIKMDLPPSTGYIAAFPSIFEEIMWRGVMLVLFNRFYSAKKSILITGLGFSFLHLLNLLGGVPLEFVTRQVIFTAGMGIFYGVLVLRSDSLLPAMLFHYLVNLFIGSFSYYFQSQAPDRTQILYLLILIPITTYLLISWVRFYSKKWLSETETPAERAGQIG